MYNFNPQQPAVGISSCLLGEPVRFDGGHKHLPFCSETLSQYWQLIPACPEMAIGLGTPRPSIRLQKEADGIIARSADGDDLTAKLTAFSHHYVETLGSLSGYILCAKSPSCGLERVRIYQSDSKDHSKTGTGIFAAHLQQRWPLLPLEDSGRLNDASLRENFITRVYLYHQWQSLLHDGVTAQELIQFHTSNKYLLMAHSQIAYKELGQLLSNLSSELETKADRYINILMQAMKKPASRNSHTNVLHHLQGYYKKHLNSGQRQELARVIADYNQGLLPLLAPLTLLRHYQSQHPSSYLQKQRYWQPHPYRMGLRNG